MTGGELIKLILSWGGVEQTAGVKVLGIKNECR